MRNLVFIGAILICNIGTDCFCQEGNLESVQLHWKPAVGYNGKDNLDLALVLKNNSESKLDLGKWDLWFNAMYPVIEKKTAEYTFTNERRNLFRLQFAGQVMKPNDSLEMVYTSKYAISNISTVPNGFYFQNRENKGLYYKVSDVHYSPIMASAADQNIFNLSLFERNERLNKVEVVPPIFPTPKSIKVERGEYSFPSTLRYSVSSDLHILFDLEKDISFFTA